MIGFFRRIRRKLAEGNKFLKYSRYAIGEIVLVVIGILIALQVNNWNEERKGAIAQNEALKKLKLDLENDIKRLNSLDSVYSSWNNQAEYILNEILNSSEQITSDSEFHVGRGSMNYFIIKTTTYDEMVNTGTFYKLKDKDLFEIIGEYYEFANIEIMKINQDNQMYYEFVLRQGASSLNTNMRLASQRNLEYIDWSWIRNPNSEKYQDFETKIVFHKSAIKANRLLISQLIEKAEDVIIMLDNNNQALN